MRERIELRQLGPIMIRTARLVRTHGHDGAEMVRTQPPKMQIGNPVALALYRKTLSQLDQKGVTQHAPIDLIGFAVRD